MKMMQRFSLRGLKDRPIACGILAAVCYDVLLLILCGLSPKFSYEMLPFQGDSFTTGCFVIGTLLLASIVWLVAQVNLNRRRKSTSANLSVPKSN